MQQDHALDRRRLIAGVTALIGATIAGKTGIAAGPSIRLRPDDGPPGTSVRVRGRDFSPGGSGIINWPELSQPISSFIADELGDFEVEILAPNAVPGAYKVVAQSADDSLADDIFTVEGIPTTVATLPIPESISSATPVASVDTGATSSDVLREIEVGNVVELGAALADATPGDRITLADGRYVGNFVLAASGTERARIIVQGSRAAVVDGGDWGASGYGLHLQGDYLSVIGFTVTNAQKGVMADGSNHILIEGIEVHTVGHEAIHLRTHSSDNLVTGCDIHDTGLDNEKFGEGVYIGSAVSNWEKYTDGGPDRSLRNRVIANRIWNTTSECVDIKEGTEGGLVEGNIFDGAALVGADSWVDVKGNAYVIRGNVGTTSPKDGFQTHVIDNLEWGRNNIFEGNTATVNADGYGFYIHQPDSTGNIVRCDNVVVGATVGVTNLADGCNG